MNRSRSAAVRAAALRLADRSRIDALFPATGAGLRRAAFVALVAACFAGMRCAVLRAEEPPINAEAAQAVRPEPNEPAVAELPDGGEPSRETAAPEAAAEPAAPAAVRPRIRRSSPDDELTPQERGMLRLMEFVTGTWFLMLGASVGSFLNVVVYRMPLGIPLSRPKSRCPACLTPIARGDNIPIVSWLRLRGRCRSCHAPISPRYALVEAGTGLLWLGFAWCELLSGGKNLPVREPNGYAGVVWILWYTKWDLLGIYLYHQFLLCTLLAAALISLDGHGLPRRLLAVAAAVGFLAPVVWPGLHPVPFRLPHPEWLRAWRWSFSWSEAWFSGGWRQNGGVGLEGALDGLLGAVAGGALGTLAGSIASRGPRRERHDAAATGALAGLYVGWQSAFSTALLAIAALVAARAAVRIARRSANVPPVACLFAAVVAQILFWRALADVRSWPGPHSHPAVFGGAALVVVVLCLVARALEPGDAAHVSTIGERPRSPIS